jgi:hypothetical protein
MSHRLPMGNIMNAPPSSTVFGDLTWDVEMPSFPSLEGCWRLADGRECEVSLTGEWTNEGWFAFLRRAERTVTALPTAEKQILNAALARILALHRSYFPGRWTAASEALLDELSLRLVCFYDDGTVHLWYEGSAAFNHLDVDLGLDAELRVAEVRFDG